MIRLGVQLMEQINVPKKGAGSFPSLSEADLNVSLISHGKVATAALCITPNLSRSREEEADCYVVFTLEPEHILPMSHSTLPWGLAKSRSQASPRIDT